jgi:uncharacterized protein YbjT (DUF2867 family)
VVTSQPTILLTGASGFVGRALLPELQRSELVRCLVRDASRLEEVGPADVVEADLSDVGSLAPAIDGAQEVYYLVHSMEPGGDTSFVERDREAAANYVEVARSCGVRRTIYLGGVGADDESSEHIASRLEVEGLLGEAGPEFVALRASMIVGAGSASFGTLVRIVDRLPVLAFPSWRDRRTQPIAIADVVAALAAARHVEPGVYEIAGPDALSFQEMCEVIGELLGGERPSFPLPFSNARLEAAAASLVTGADAELLEPLMAGMHADLTVEQNALPGVFGIEPTPFRDAARDALAGMAGVSPIG